MTRIIGIAGRKYAGKDTAANVLVEQFGYVNVKFATGIKTIARAFFTSLGYPEDALFDLTEGVNKEVTIPALMVDAPSFFKAFVQKEHEVLFNVFQLDIRQLDLPEFTGITSRQFQQFVGTEIGRDLVSKSVWTDAGIRDALQYDKAVISDVRFPNEVDVVHDQGGIVIRIERNTDASQFSDHPSETAIDTLAVDVVIDNNHTLEDLSNSVRIAANEGNNQGLKGWFKSP